MGKPTTVTLKDLENFLSSRRSAPREGGGLSRAASALRRAEEERQAQRSVFNQPREPEWQPDHVRPGGHALEAPMISPDDLIGTGIPTKIAMALKGAAPLIGGLGVIKNKGGNWLNGSVEDALSGLKQRAYDARNTEEAVSKTNALNSFIDKQLTRYVKNDMATPEDPIRALAERGVLHVDPDMTRLADLSVKRGEAGFSAQPPSEVRQAQYWNNLADQAVNHSPAEIYQNFGSSNLGLDWVNKLDPKTPFYRIEGANQDLGFDHLIDELSNAINPESGLPRNLLLDPKSMDRVSVPQAVERVAAINAWRAAQKAEADAIRANNAATVLHKEYPDKGFKWVELKAGETLPEGYTLRHEAQQSGPGGYRVLDPSGKPIAFGATEQEAAVAANRGPLADALKYEGDTMGHCVGGYCDDVASGRTKIYSLRDAKGQPHVTIEVAPNKSATMQSFEQWAEDNGMEIGEEALTVFNKNKVPGVPSIKQIKGKGNRAPNEEYLPFVQDFVKSGKWSDVGDLQNAGLQRAGWAPDVLERMKAHGIEAPEYGTADEINAALNALNKAKGFAEGGPVGTQYPRIGGGLSKAAGALRRAEEERQFKKSVFAQPRVPEWQPDHVRPGGHALEAPMISPDDLFGTGIPTKIAMALKGAAPLIGGLGVIKNKGGNWLTGSVEGALSGLRRPETGNFNPPGNWVPEPVAPALNSFIDKQLTRYVKNDMATERDPIRALAERGTLHFQPEMVAINPPTMRTEASRIAAGFPGEGMGKAQLAKQWEVSADNSIVAKKAGAMGRVEGLSPKRMAEENPWLAKVPEGTPVYDAVGRERVVDLGFSHLTDELANALNPESGLPRHLLLDPKSMDRVSVPQAVERVAAINAWRAAQKAEADMLRANNAATVLHKEYPDKGFKWVELKAPENAPRVPGTRSDPKYQLPEEVTQGFYEQAHREAERRGISDESDDLMEYVEGRVEDLAQTWNKKNPLMISKELQDALKYEGDTMGHCVGGYCDDVASGRSKIYSLRDAKGQPHVTVEVNPSKKLSENDLPDDVRDMLAETYGDASREEFEAAVARAVQERQTGDRIIQIKGKGNRAPNEEYLPFVQDFVKSGKWSDVGDLGNARLMGHREAWEHLNSIDPVRADKFMDLAPGEGYWSLKDLEGFAHGGSVQQTKPFTVQDLQAIIAQINQEHLNAA